MLGVTVPDQQSQRVGAAALRKLTGSRWVGVLAALAVLVVAFFVVRDRLPEPSQIWTALAGAGWFALAMAVLLQAVSVGLVARAQRLLLGAWGVPVSPGRAQAISYASGAVALCLPAGGLVSSGYAYREYRSAGADPVTATTVMVLSGVLAAAGLGLAAASVPAAEGASWWVGSDPGRAAIAATAAAVAGTALYRLAARWPGRAGTAPPPAGSDADVVSRYPRVAAVLRGASRSVRQTASLPGVVLRGALTASTLKWLADAACLAAVCWSLDLRVALIPLFGVYLGVQLARQLPFTPGGAGFVEAAMLGGLLAAGASAGPAAAAVLCYRVISAWAVIPIGAVAGVLLRHGYPRR